MTEQRKTMDWEGFFTHYRKPGFVPGFEIVNRLGSGVFGEVYKARKESIGKFYAIKFLKVSDEKISEAIFKELDSLRFFAQLDHPNLVTIEDKGEVMGIPYIVMGYAGDETLKKILNLGAMSHQDIAAVFPQIAAGVAALHEKSIIHFDLKPANIFMKGGHARVGDYGLSKLVSESHKTMSIGRGTPYYMAPEMLKRQGDHRSDIYSLGVILYEMLTGEVPFTGDSEWVVLKKHEEEQLKIPEDMPPQFAAAIEKAMAKDPSKRFQSVGAFQEALGFGDGLPMPSATPPKLGMTPPPLPANRRGARLEVDEQVIENLSAVLDLIQRTGGDRAIKARKKFRKQKAKYSHQEELKRNQEDKLGSFYSDFEEEDHDKGKKGAKARIKPGLNVTDEASASGFSLPWPIWILVSPFLLVGFLFKLVFRGLGMFFQDFLRYAVILVLTIGLALLIHGAIRGNFSFLGF